MCDYGLQFIQSFIDLRAIDEEYEPVHDLEDYENEIYFENVIIQKEQDVDLDL